MLPVGRGLLVILVACLCLMPARAGAATIALGTVSSGGFDITGTFGADNDVALIYLSLLGTAVVSAEMTSHLDTPAGFDPILTLLGPGSDFLGAFDYLSANGMGFLDPMTLAAGTYVLAITHDGNNYFPADGSDEFPVGRFEYDGAASGLLTSILSGGGTTCGEFVSVFGECRTREFAGTLSIQPEDVQPVPEPGSLALLMVGGAVLLARRRRLKRPDASDRA